MKKKLFLIAYILGISIFNFAQTCEWAKSIGSIGNDDGYDIAVVDLSGNIYVAGVFSKTIILNSDSNKINLTSKGGYDVFLSKYSSTGKLIWIKDFGGLCDDKGLSLTVDDSNYIYLTGYFSGIINFNSATDLNQITLTSKGGKDIFLSKYSSSGELIYSKSFGGVCDDWGINVTVDHVNNVYLTGSFNDTVNFNPNDKLKSDSNKVYLISNGNNDIFLSKYSSSGKLIWAKNFGSIGSDWGHELAIDDSNNVYITGVFSNAINFNSENDSTKFTSKGCYDIFLSKYSETGKLIYAKTFGGIGDDKGLSLAIDDSCNIYLTGYFSNEVNFDSDNDQFILKSNGKTDIFLTKHSQSGKLIYAKSFGGSSDDWGVSLSVDKFYNVYLTGGFDGEINFNPNPKLKSDSNQFILKSNGKTDIFLSKYSSSGELIYAKNFGGVCNDWGNSVVVDNLENIYITGSFNYEVGFNPGITSDNLISKGNDDIFIAKYNNSLNTNVLSYSKNFEFKIYPNPAKTFLFISSKEPVDIKIYNLVGKLFISQKNISRAKILISDLSSGLYFVEFQQGSRKEVKKLIIY